MAREKQDFCGKYGHPPRSGASVGPFLEKLASKNQTETQREQAAMAVGLLVGAWGDGGSGEEAGGGRRAGGGGGWARVALSGGRGG